MERGEVMTKRKKRRGLGLGMGEGDKNLSVKNTRAGLN